MHTRSEAALKRPQTQLDVLRKQIQANGKRNREKRAKVADLGRQAREDQAHARAERTRDDEGPMGRPPAGGEGSARPSPFGAGGVGGARSGGADGDNDGGSS